MERRPACCAAFEGAPPGSWAAVPATGVAKIVADADAGNEATCLHVEASGEELALTPAALQSATGMETVASEVCTDAVDTLPSLDAQAQAVFAIYSGSGAAPALMGYVSGGWTNIVCAAGADTLTNAWFTRHLDFAAVSNVRYVRFSVKPAAASSATAIADSGGTLVLSAAPLYTGDTYLDGGALKIPATWTNKVKTHVSGKSVR